MLDEICDAIEEVVLLFIYVRHQPADDVSEFIIQLKECEKLSELFRDFENHKRNRDKLLNIIKEVNTIEEDGDRFYINVMKALLKKQTQRISSHGVIYITALKYAVTAVKR